jgi:hypothetical protein
MTAKDDLALADTRRWLERAVIGLNLCPFAKAVHAKGQVHYATCDVGDTAGVIQVLDEELRALVAIPPSERDTTLLVLTAGFEDFLEFTLLAGEGERLLRQRGCEGVVQLASFHPRFEFGDAPPDAMGHHTNRSPYPTLHLLREASIDRAVAAFPDAEAIYGANIETLEHLGPEGWKALGVGRST